MTEYDINSSIDLIERFIDPSNQTSYPSESDVTYILCRLIIHLLKERNEHRIKEDTKNDL